MSHVSREKIEKFHNKVMENKRMAQDPRKFRHAKQDLVLYHEKTIQGTNDSSSIKIRFKIIAKYFHIDAFEIVNLNSAKDNLEN